MLQACYNLQQKLHSNQKRVIREMLDQLWVIPYFPII